MEHKRQRIDPVQFILDLDPDAFHEELLRRYSNLNDSTDLSSTYNELCMRRLVVRRVVRSLCVRWAGWGEGRPLLNLYPHSIVGLRTTTDDNKR